MSRITGHQNPSVAIQLSLPGLKSIARQPRHFTQGDVPAEHAADAVPEFGSGHRRIIVDRGLLVFGGLDPQNSRVE